MWKAVVLGLLACAAILEANQKCHRDSRGVMRYNGKPCATTTRYNDGHRGSCGCGPRASDNPFEWNMAEYMTAPSQKYFDWGGDAQWCGRNCGKCVQLCLTGGWINGEGGPGGSEGQCHTFMVTNDCPYGGNEKWCEIHNVPGSGQTNSFGYEVHFDLQNARGQVDRLGWNNPEVTWQEVGCPSHYNDLKHQCECNMH